MTNNANLEGKGPRERFHIEHGEKPFKFGGWWVYEDGAKLEESPHGSMMEPSSKPYELWQTIVRYREEAVRRAVKAFDNFKEMLLDDESAWAMQDEYLRNLRKLKSTVRVCRRELEEARTKFAEHDPRAPLKRSPEEEKRRAEDAARLDEARQKFSDELNKIKV
jgi:hypothetical protein